MDALLIVVAVVAGLFLLSLTPPGADFRRRMMAHFYDGMIQRYETWVAERKRVLLADLAGTVLELGPGTGNNFRHLPSGVRRWIGIEPNPHMHAQLRAAAAGRDLELDFRGMAVEHMAVADGSVDAVLGTLVLCSVPDPGRVVRDVRRVLRPGGRFVFIEHVAAPRGTRLRRWQRLLRPWWRYCGDGCCPDRELGAVIRGAGFAEVRLEEFRVPPGVIPGIVSPQIAGIAVKGENGGAPP